MPMPTVTVRFYEELNDFLPPEKRKRRYEVTFPERRSVKDLAESEGVPHTEIDLLLVNGESVGFDCLVGDGDDVAVYPVFESLDISTVSRLGRPPLRSPRFVADVHLGKLVRRLRLLGFDCSYGPDFDDARLAERSAREERILLTRDRQLLMRAMVMHGIFVRSGKANEQVRQVLDRLDLYGHISPWSRCLSCNGRICQSDKSQVRDLVPAYTFRTVEDFYRCVECGKVFWKGTHWPKLVTFIEQARRGACSPPRNSRQTMEPEDVAKT